MARRFTICSLLAALFILPAVSLEGKGHQEEHVHRYTVAGTHALGVWDTMEERLVVDTLYQAVEIFDDLFFECYFDRYWDDGKEILLNGYVVEIWDAEGHIVSRDFDLLLEHDTPPYSNSEAYARAMGFKNLEATILFKNAMNLEQQGFRRDALKGYVAAYRMCPSLTLAKERATTIQKAMRGEQQAIQDQINREKAEEALRQAQQEASMQAVSAALNSMAGTLSQIEALRRQSAAQPHRQASASSSSTSGGSSSSGNSNSVSRTKSKTREAEKLISKNRVEHARWSLLEKKIIPCTLCHGSKSCNFCTGRGHVNGTVTCNYCHGSGDCARCGGTGQIEG